LRNAPPLRESIPFSRAFRRDLFDKPKSAYNMSDGKATVFSLSMVCFPVDVQPNQSLTVRTDPLAGYDVVQRNRRRRGNRSRGALLEV
jgi:hypothetical protein